jgi:hypothetical protein
MDRQEEEDTRHRAEIKKRLQQKYERKERNLEGEISELKQEYKERAEELE